MTGRLNPAKQLDSESRNRTDLIEIQFRNYKALRRFDIHVKRTNIFVGANNNGKSTVIGALRILSAGMRKATSARPTSVRDESYNTFGWDLTQDAVPVSLENVHTDYADTDTTVLFKFANGNSLKLYFPSEGGCSLIPITENGRVQSPKSFLEEFPFGLAVVPVLGPLEHNEKVVTRATVRQNLDTHRASRNFRNYWYQNPDGFDHFAELIQTTWPGVEIVRPYLENNGEEVFMFAKEARIPRELYWCGFGFQIWCQLLTQISRNHNADLIVVDEPEVYLHPDVQRQLLSVLRDAGPSIALATHSTEIMAEAEPSELVLIDKSRTHGRRLENGRAVQAVFAGIGSIHNVAIVQAAKTRKVLFVEDTADFAILQRFAKVLNLHRLANDTTITVISSGGYGSWKGIKDFPQKIEQATKEKYFVAAIYDRDYRCQEDLDIIGTSLREQMDFASILARKEIENYLLVPKVLDRIVSLQLIAGGRPDASASEIGSAGILSGITDQLKHDVLAQYTARKTEYLRKRGQDDSKFIAETSAWIDREWVTLDGRLRIVPGKRVLSEFRSVIAERFKVSFSDSKIAENFEKDQVPSDLVVLLERLASFAAL
jgi:hypothetical protein